MQCLTRLLQKQSDGVFCLQICLHVMEAFLYDRTSNLLFLVWVQLHIEIQRFIFGCSGQKSRCLVSFLIASGRSSQIRVYYVCPDRSSDFIWDLGKLPFPLHLEKSTHKKNNTKLRKSRKKKKKNIFELGKP